MSAHRTVARREEARLRHLLGRLYGTDPRLPDQLDGLLDDIRAARRARPAELLELDERRAAEPDWFRSNSQLGGVCYVDRYAGTIAGLGDRLPYFRELGLTMLHLMPLFEAPAENSDGGYAVSSYRRVAQELGTMSDLSALAADLRAAGISLALDFVFNHTSNEHEWARRALAGDPDYRDFYWIFDDRTMPDAYESTTREIFPEDHPGSFTRLPDGRWIWSTFHSFQLDLNYSNPAVFRAMAGEMMFLANQGVEILRMDAVAFIWKRLGTSCENQPEAHLLLQAFNAVMRLAAPAVVFLSEAIVHPDDVISYVDPDECPLSYNPLQMALTWSTLATRDVGLLSLALAERHSTPPGTAWVNYLRSHDDIGWTFADEDARRLGVDPDEHRRFLNRFYVGEFEGSFARGVAFQTNEKTGDSRVSGATASLAGLDTGDPLAEGRILLAQSIALSTGGLPLIYLGDEVGQRNDLSYLDEPALREDSRWAGRPHFPAELVAQRDDPATSAGRLYAGMRAMIAARKRIAAFGGGTLIPFDTHLPGVLGYLRPGRFGPSLLALVNVGDRPATVSALTLSGQPPAGVDALTGERVDLRRPLRLAEASFRWILV